MSRSDRERNLNQRGCTLFFTGLSGSGKSTIAAALERELFLQKKATYVLDGDNVRHGLCKDLGFTSADRQENIRRIGEVCKLFTDAGLIVLAAFVSPYKDDRDQVRSLLNNGETMISLRSMLKQVLKLVSSVIPKDCIKRQGQEKYQILLVLAAHSKSRLIPRYC